MNDAVEHVSCERCGRIFHASDLDELGLCPDCAAPPSRLEPPREEE